MRRFVVGVVLWTAGVPGLPAQDLPQWVLSLSRIKRQMKAELLRLPNYACAETVTRSVKTPKDAALKPLDTLRLEVAFIDGKEMFAPEGGAQFQDVGMEAFASGGILATGSFTAITRNLFVNDGGRTTGHGQEKLGDQDALWYGFEISEMFHAFKITGNGAEGYAGERGKFWVDAATLDLLRIENHAFDIPEYLGIRDILTTITYTRVPIGSSLLLLPQISDSVITEESGKVNKNVAEFSRCREYGSESTIRFGPDEPEPKPPVPPKKK